MKIVIAWKEINGETEIVPDKFEMRDRNYYPVTRNKDKKCAVLWLNDGKKQDKIKAKEYANKNIEWPVKVFAFDDTENDPLNKARSLI